MTDSRPEDVFELIHTAMHLFRTRQIHALRENAPGVTHMEARVLGFFAKNPGETLTALINKSGRDKGQLARLLAGLRERGLLAGQADENDRRNLRLYLTPEGESIANVIGMQNQLVSRIAVQDFSDEDERTLALLLVRLLHNLEEKSGLVTEERISTG